ncbi:MAG: hypothetical protein RSP_21030 [Rhodanobacter sp.]
MNTTSRSLQRTSRRPVEPMSALPRLRQQRLALSPALALGSMAFCSGAAAAAAGGVAPTTMPVGGVIVGGVGSITQSGASTVVNQQSALLALNWQSFNLGKDATVLFNQPSHSAIALNRIFDQNPSQIFGHINSNGQVFLINTHGIIFGSSAQLNVGGLVASTLDLTPDDFLSNHFNLDAHGGSAGIVNHGTIEAASGGSVSLIGGKVENDGLIVANLGSIHLDGADKAVLDFDGDGLVGVQITGALQQRLTADEAAVANKGTLQAEGGTVVLQASAAKDLFTDLVNNSGVIDAHGISTDGGVVRLVGSGGNTVDSGSIDASGVHGGSVQLLSDQGVGVMGGTIDASGTQGGGSIRVGGGWQGGEGLQVATVSYVGPDAKLDADATQSGDGGSVVVWGNQGNNFYGSISARGGASGGDGGRVETSAHDGLNVHGNVDASAPNGSAGTWLLDPYDVTIATGGTAFSNPFTAAATSTIDPANIDSALKSNTNVFVFTNTQANGTDSGNITVASPIVASGAGSLYLQAVGSIFLNANISSDGTHALNVNLWANYGGAAQATSYTSNAACPTCQVIVGDTASAAIATNGGNVNIQTGDGTHAGGSVQLGSSGTITGSIDTSSSTNGALNIVATGIAQQSSGASTIKAGVTSLNAGSGAITLDNAGNDFIGTVGVGNSGTNDVTLNNGSHALALNASNIGGALTLTSSGGITLGGSVTSGGAQAYNGNVLLGSDMTLTTTNSAVDFTGTVDNATSTARALTISAGTGAVTFGGAVGGSSNGGLASLSATGGSLTLDGNVTTVGSQTYTGPVDLGSGVTLTTTNSAVDFTGTVDSATSTAEDLTVSAGSGAVTFGGAVGGTHALGALIVNGTGATSFGAVDASSLSTNTGTSTLGGDITTSGAQTYNGNVLLSSGVTLATTNSAVDFTGTVDSATSTAEDLTVSAGSGAVTFGGAVGGTHALGALIVNGTGATSFGAVDASSLSTNTGTSTLGGDITTSGAQTYNGNVLIGSGVTLTTTNSAVDFTGTVDSATSTAEDLTVSAGSGAVTFGGAVGGTHALGALVVNGTGATSFGAVDASSLSTNTGTSTLGGDITTSGAQTYNGNVLIGSGVTLTTTNSAVDFTGTVDSATSTAEDLTVSAGSGAVTFGGAVGGTHALGALIVNGTGATSFGAVDASSLSTNTGTSTLGGDITTSGAQTYNGNVLLGSGVTLATTNSAVDFTGTVDSATSTAEDLTVSAGSGAVTFGGAVGGTHALGALVVNGTGATSFGAVDASSLSTNTGTSTLGGDITTSGAQTYNGNVLLGSGVTLATTNSAVDFTGTVDSATSTAEDLTVSAGSGAVTFGGAVGGTHALGALIVNGTGATSFGAVDASSLSTNTGTSTLGGDITTSGAQTYNGNVLLGSGVTLATTNSAVDFTGTVDSATSTAEDLTVSAGSGAVTFGGAVGGTHALGALVVNGTGATSFGAVDASSLSTNAGTSTLGGDITTSGAQTYNGSVLLGGNATLTSTGSGAIDLASTVNGGHALTVDTAGVTTFGGVVGGTTQLTSLTTDAAGSTTLDGNVSTTGSQTYNDAVTLGSNVTLTTTNSAVDFASTVDNASTTAEDLTVNAGSGALTFGGAVGGGSNGALNALTTDSGTLNAGALAVGAGGLSVTTTAGAITQGGAWTVSGTSSFDAGAHAITLNNAGNNFAGVVTLTNSGSNAVYLDNGGHTLTVGMLSLGSGALTLTDYGATPLVLTNDVTTDGGAVSFGGAVALGSANITIDTTGGGTAATGANISFGGDVSGTTAGGSSLTLTAGSGGAVTLGTVGGAYALNALTISGSTTLNGNVSTTGGQTYNDAVTLGGNATLTSTGSGAIDLASTVNGGYALTVDTAGVTTFGGVVGGTTQLTSLTTDAAGSTTLDGNVSTTGGQTYNDAVTLGGNATLTSTGGGAIDLASTVNGGYALTVDTAGVTTFGGVVGGTTQLTSLTTDAAGSTTLDGNVSTIGSQTYNDAVTLGSNVTLTTTNSAVDFASTVDNASTTAEDLTVNAGSGALTFGGAVGGGSNGALNALTTDSGTLNAGALAVGAGGLSVTTTAGAITQGGAWTVSGTSSFDAGAHAITLNNAGNNFAGAVSLTNSGSNAVYLDNGGHALTLGTLSLGSGALTLTDYGATPLVLTNDVTTDGGAVSFGGAVTLGSANITIDTTGGGTAATGANISFGGDVSGTTAGGSSLTLTAGSGGAVSLVGVGGSNALNNLTIDAKSLTAPSTLAVDGGLSIHTVDTLTTGTDWSGASVTLAGDAGLILNGNVTATGGGAVQLTSSGGAISQSGGVITAGMLTGSSSGSTTLADANQVGALGNFSANGFSLTNAQALTVAASGTVSGGTGGTALTVSTGNLAIDGTVGNIGGTTTLKTLNGMIGEGANGILYASTLTGSSSGDTTLDAANNQVAALGSFSAANFSLIDAHALTTSGALTATGNLSLKTTGSGNSLSVNQSLSGGAVTLDSSSGLTVGSTVTGSSVALSVSGDLAINAQVNSGSGATTLTSSGSIGEGSGGVIAAGTLTGTSTGGTALNGANQVGTLGNFTSNGFSLTNAQVLTVAGTIDGGSGATNIATSSGALTVYGNVSGGSVALGGQGGLGVNGNIDSGAGTTTLTSGSTISEGSGSVITAGTLTGSSSGATVLGGANAIAQLGNFTANGFSFTNAQALTVSGTVNGGSGTTSLATTAGNLTVAGSAAGSAVKLAAAGIAINGNVNSGSGTTTLSSTGSIGEGGSGVVTAGTLTGSSTGSTTLDGANAIGTLGSFSANGLSLRNAQALTVAGTVSGGSGTASLATTAEALTLNGTVGGSAVSLAGAGGLAINAGVNSGSGTTTLTSGGAISEGASGFVAAGILTGTSGGSTALTGANQVASLGDFSANGFSFTNARALTLAGRVNGGSSATLTTTSGDLSINGALSGTFTTLNSAGAITEGAGGSITAGTLAGRAAGATALGTAAQFIGNHVGTLGNFSSPAGFSFTDAQSLTLASVNGSAFTVNAGTSSLYLGVHGDLLQQGTTWLYDGGGTWSATGRMGTGAAPIYVTGVSEQVVSLVGTPPAYFYAVNAQGGLLPVVGAPSVNVPTSALTSRAQNGNNHGDAYIDPSVVNANYRSFGIVPSGILLPPDQQNCQPGQPASSSCPDND